MCNEKIITKYDVSGNPNLSVNTSNGKRTETQREEEGPLRQYGRKDRGYTNQEGKEDRRQYREERQRLNKPRTYRKEEIGDNTERW